MIEISLISQMNVGDKIKIPGEQWTAHHSNFYQKLQDYIKGDGLGRHFEIESIPPTNTTPWKFFLARKI